MSNQLNDALVVLVGVVTAYYIWAICSGVWGVLTNIYAYFRQREQQKQRNECGYWHGLGRLFNQSHASLRDDFEVSCTELDALAEACRAEPRCFGARMTGAGFGGAAVALLHREGLDQSLARICATYAQRTGLEAGAFEVHSLGGVRHDD